MAYALTSERVHAGQMERKSVIALFQQEGMFIQPEAVDFLVRKGDAVATAKNLILTNPVKNNGVIVIADVYLYPHVKNTGQFKDYETLKQLKRGYSHYSDEIIILEDYKSSLWEHDYNMTRRIAKQALGKLKSKKERAILHRYLATLVHMDEIDKMGAALWCIKVKK